MKYTKVPKRLIEETKSIIRLYQFLRYDCGLKFADRLSAKDLNRILAILQDRDSSSGSKLKKFLTQA